MTRIFKLPNGQVLEITDVGPGSDRVRNGCVESAYNWIRINHVTAYLGQFGEAHMFKHESGGQTTRRFFDWIRIRVLSPLEQLARAAE